MQARVNWKHITQKPETDDGARILVDPSLPEDIASDRFALDEWYAKAAPSQTLRQALHTERIDTEEFARRYRDELSAKIQALTPLLKYAQQQQLTLLSAAKPPLSTFLPILQQALLAALAADQQLPTHENTQNTPERSAEVPKSN